MDLKETTLACRNCGLVPRVEDFLSGCGAYWPQLRIVVHRCGRCGNKEEIRLNDDEILIGYTYAAAALHFAPMERVRVPGLRAICGPDGCSASFEGAEVTVRPEA